MTNTKFFTNTLTKSISDSFLKRDYDLFYINVYEYAKYYFLCKNDIGVFDNEDLAGEFIISGKVKKIFDKKFQKESYSNIIGYIRTSLKNFYLDKKDKNKFIFCCVDNIKSLEKENVGIDSYLKFVDTLKEGSIIKEVAESMLDVEKYESLRNSCNENYFRVKLHRLKNKYKNFLV